MIALLASVTLAGAAVHTGDHECRMHGMEDCCEVAKTQSAAPEVLAARLCCVINCPQPAPTTSNFAVQPAQATPAQLHATAASSPPSMRPPVLSRKRTTRARAPDSQPAYIQHLALLI